MVLRFVLLSLLYATSCMAIIIEEHKARLDRDRTVHLLSDYHESANDWRYPSDPRKIDQQRKALLEKLSRISHPLTIYIEDFATDELPDHPHTSVLTLHLIKSIREHCRSQTNINATNIDSALMSRWFTSALFFIDYAANARLRWYYQLPQQALSWTIKDLEREFFAVLDASMVQNMKLKSLLEQQKNSLLDQWNILKDTLQEVGTFKNFSTDNLCLIAMRGYVDYCMLRNRPYKNERKEIEEREEVDRALEAAVEKCGTAQYQQAWEHLCSVCEKLDCGFIATHVHPLPEKVISPLYLKIQNQMIDIFRPFVEIQCLKTLFSHNHDALVIAGKDHIDAIMDILRKLGFAIGKTTSDPSHAD